MDGGEVLARSLAFLFFQGPVKPPMIETQRSGLFLVGKSAKKH
jgi:hypothetical protein